MPRKRLLVFFPLRRAPARLMCLLARWVEMALLPLMSALLRPTARRPSRRETASRPCANERRTSTPATRKGCANPACRMHLSHGAAGGESTRTPPPCSSPSAAGQPDAKAKRIGEPLCDCFAPRWGLFWHAAPAPCGASARSPPPGVASGEYFVFSGPAGVQYPRSVRGTRSPYREALYSVLRAPPWVRGVVLKHQQTNKKSKY